MDKRQNTDTQPLALLTENEVRIGVQTFVSVWWQPADISIGFSVWGAHFIATRYLVFARLPVSLISNGLKCNYVSVLQSLHVEELEMSLLVNRWYRLPWWSRSAQHQAPGFLLAVKWISALDASRKVSLSFSVLAVKWISAFDVSFQVNLSFRC